MWKWRNAISSESEFLFYYYTVKYVKEKMGISFICILYAYNNELS